MKTFGKTYDQKDHYDIIVDPHLGVVGDPGYYAGDGDHVPHLPRGHAHPRMSPDHTPLILSGLLRVSLGLVTMFVAEDVVSAEMQISTNCENRFGTPFYCCLEQAKELEIEFEIA